MTEKQQSITVTFLQTVIVNTHALGRLWQLKKEWQGFQYWEGHGLPAPMLMHLSACLQGVCTNTQQSAKESPNIKVPPANLAKHVRVI